MNEARNTNDTKDGVLQGDVLARILSYLGWRRVVLCRAVCRPWRDAVAITPVVEVIVDTVSMANRLFLSSQATTTTEASGEREERRIRLLPQLQSLVLLEQQQQHHHHHHHHHHRQQIDATASTASTTAAASTTTTTTMAASTPSTITDEHIAGALKCFLHLKQLTCRETTSLRTAMLDGILIQQQQQIQHQRSSSLRVLNLHNCHYLSWRLSDLVRSVPQLQDLRCINNRNCRGSLQDLRPLRRSLTVLDISGCDAITGHFLDLADDSSALRWLGIARTSVRGDVRELRPGHYPALQSVGLDSVGIYGAHEIHRVAHARDVMRARHQVRRQSKEEIPIYPFLLHLSTSSPDYHERIEQRLYTSNRDPPFQIEQIVVGDRWGWRWSNMLGG